MSKMFLTGRLDADDMIDDTGLVPAGAMDEGFQSLKPTDRVVQQVNLWQNLWNDQWVEGFLAMNRWARDQVPFPGAAFRQTVDVLIRQNALLEGVIPFGRGEVRLKDITCPFLNVYCEQDTIVPAPVFGAAGGAGGLAGRARAAPAVRPRRPRRRPLGREGRPARRSPSGSPATAEQRSRAAA